MNEPDFKFNPKILIPSIEDPYSRSEDETQGTVVKFDSSNDVIFTPVVGGHLNFSTPETDDEEYPGRQFVDVNDVDVNDVDTDIPSDIYLTLVIVSVSLIVLVLLSYALYKAVRMLKVSMNDGREDSLPVPGESRSPNVPTSTVTPTSTSSVTPVTAESTNVAHLANSQPATSTPRRQSSIVTQAQNSFIQGIRSFHAPIFSTLTRRHEDDSPPPYDEPSPPPYHIAIQMKPNFEDGFKLDPIKINERSNREFDSISLDSGDVTDGIKKYVSVAIVV